MGKSYSTMQNVVQNEKKRLHWHRCSISLHKRSTMMKKFIVWTKSCIRGILGHNCRWVMILLSLVFKAPRSTYFRILYYVSAKFFNILNATKLGRTELQEYEPRGTTAILRTSKESRRNSSGIFSQGSQRCSSLTKFVICWVSLGQSPETFTGRILLCQCSMTSLVTVKTTKNNV